MVLVQEPVKKKGRTVTSEKVKEESPNFPVKPKPKKQASIKKDNQADKSRSDCLHAITVHLTSLWVAPYFLFFGVYVMNLSSLELPYVTPLENKQRKSFTSKALYPLANIPKTRPMQKQRRECRERFQKYHSALCLGTRFGVWHVWSDSRWKAGRHASLTLGQAVVQQLGARTRPQQRFWGGKGVCPSRVGRANFQEQPP